MNPADAANDLPLPKVQMAFACEGISTDPFQRVSFNNVIDQLGSANFPAVTPQVFAVFGFEASIPQILSRVRLVIEAPDHSILVDSPMQDIALTNDRFKARAVNGLMGMQWNGPGRHIFKLMSGHRELASFTVSVIQQQIPNIPGGQQQ
jgi:hypothetical protein